MAKEYIDREVAIAQCRRHSDYTAWSIESGIEGIPATDVAPVVHACWIEGHDYIKCSVCRGMTKRDFRDGCWNYCPNCGANMDGGKENAAD